MHKLLQLLLFFLATHATGVAQFETHSDFFGTDFSQSDLKYKPSNFSGSLYELLDSVFYNTAGAEPLKGLTVAIILPDDSIWKRAYGLAEELPDSISLTPEHLLPVQSITKSFVSATMLLLYEDGLLSLDDSIGKYVGPYPNVPGETTIRQLLGHRSGISDYLNQNPAFRDTAWSFSNTLWHPDTILYNYVLQPNFPVGSNHRYSNTNYLLAGLIIEQITGKPWYEEVRARILAPLGLSSTFAYPYESLNGLDLAHSYHDVNGDGVLVDVEGSGYSLEGWATMFNSVGCFVSTPEDLVIFHKALYGGNILQAATLAEMQTDYTNPTQNYIYGLGTLNHPNASCGLGLEGWGHDGAGVGKSVAFYYPDLDIAAAIIQSERVVTSNVGCALFTALADYLNPTSSIKETALAKSLTIFPNPTTGIIQITGVENGYVRVVDQVGSTCKEGILTPSGVNISEFPNGVYFIQIRSDNQFITRKIIKN